MQREPRSPVRPCRPNMQHLPAAPLVQAISSYVTRRQINLTRLFDQSTCRAFYRARQAGEVTLTTVEDFCDQLGLHPRQLYGDAYDRAAFTYTTRRSPLEHRRERPRQGGER
jgi:hypothetical protein